MVEDKAQLIVNDIKNEWGTSPVAIFKRMAKKEYVSIHGPEHHILDGACLLVAFKNAGGNINLNEAIEKLFYEGLRMPGAMCGLWGVCGAVTSVGAALSIIDGTGPLSDDGTWGNHMQFTSAALNELGKINGPRCCKRDAMITFKNGIEYVNEHYDVRPDDIARKELKPRGATLFPVPSREAVYKETYEEQKKANIKTLGKSLPKQASAIIPKIREVDEFMSAHPEYKNRIDESHPELDFVRLNGAVLLTRKKDAAGTEERLKVIKRFISGINIPNLYIKAKDLRCNVDDIADAICLAVTAKLKSEGLCETIPENPQMDSNGLYMKLTVPKKAVSNGMRDKEAEKYSRDASK